MNKITALTIYRFEYIFNDKLYYIDIPNLLSKEIILLMGIVNERINI